MDHVAPELAAHEVTDQNGASRRLGEAWQERTAVLVFVRHFG
jgi:hypothetical protein